MAVVTVRGVDLELHDGDWMTGHIEESGDFYEANILDHVAGLLTEPGVIVDAGAMVGNHTAYFARFKPDYTVHAFEPVRANLEVLRRNVERYPNVTVWPLALSDYSGASSIGLDPENQGHHILGEQGPMVPVRMLDEFDLSYVRLIKVDVEGSEWAVLRGALRTIARWKPLLLIEDWYGDPWWYGYTVAERWPDQQTYLLRPL